MSLIALTTSVLIDSRVKSASPSKTSNGTFDSNLRLDNSLQSEMSTGPRAEDEDTKPDQERKKSASDNRILTNLDQVNSDNIGALQKHPRKPIFLLRNGPSIDQGASWKTVNLKQASLVTVSQSEWQSSCDPIIDGGFDKAVFCMII
ncbi:hypothetical protein quinque_002077 [Culex quinquefasciatus]